MCASAMRNVSLPAKVALSEGLTTSLALKVAFLCSKRCSCYHLLDEAVILRGCGCFRLLGLEAEERAMLSLSHSGPAFKNISGASVLRAGSSCHSKRPVIRNDRKNIVEEGKDRPEKRLSCLDQLERTDGSLLKRDRAKLQAKNTRLKEYWSGLIAGCHRKSRHSIPALLSSTTDTEAWPADMVVRLPGRPDKYNHELMSWKWRPQSVAYAPQARSAIHPGRPSGGCRRIRRCFSLESATN